MIHPVDSPFTRPSWVVSSTTMYSVRASGPPRAGAIAHPRSIATRSVPCAARDDPEELAGVVAADPHPAVDVDAEAVGMPMLAEVGEDAWRTKASVGFGRKR
jgi:hypothetical protein